MTDAPADLEGVLLELGIEVTHTDDDEVWAHCPEHLRYVEKEDHSASWSVNRVSGVFNCFLCQSQGRIVDLVTRMKFPHDVFAAARWMRGFGVDLVASADLALFEQPNVRMEQAEIMPETRLAMFPDPPGWALDSRKFSLEACQHYNVRFRRTRLGSSRCATPMEHWPGGSRSGRNSAGSLITPKGSASRPACSATRSSRWVSPPCCWSPLWTS